MRKPGGISLFKRSLEATRVLFLNLGFGAIRSLGVKAEGRWSTVDEHHVYVVFPSSAEFNTTEVGNHEEDNHSNSLDLPRSLRS